MADFIAMYIEEYLEKIFYFSLKKTGNEADAEDLTQDITLCILSELEHGVVPNYFSAWVWKIAKNRYSKWADNKHKRNLYISEFSIEELDISDSDSYENEIIHKENISLLRRELAFIAADYRNILIAYYLEDKKAKDIATECNLPEGTVRNKLFRARNILKEGMHMAREFGVRSYKPENMDFCFSGMCGNNNEPLCFLEKSLCKNILLEAYGAPLTAEELAMEIGVALPYMEEELDELVASTLMTKNGTKYETDFVIISKETQMKIYNHLESIVPALTEAIIESVTFEKEYLDCIGGNQPSEDFKWMLLMAETDSAVFGASQKAKCDVLQYPVGPWGFTIRPNGGEWDIYGKETYNGKKHTSVSLYGCVATTEEKDLPAIDFKHYTFQSFGNELYNQHLSYREGQALVAVANGNTDGIEPSIINALVERKYLSKYKDFYIPNFTVLYKNKCKKMLHGTRNEWEAIRKKAIHIAAEHYDFYRKLVMEEIPENLKDNVFQIDHACANICNLRGAVMEEALRIGYLTIPDDDTRKKMLGAFLSI